MSGREPASGGFPTGTARYGNHRPPPSRLTVRAGLLEGQLEGTALRWLRVAGAEVLHSIELTLRDEAWSTILPTIADLRLDAHEGGTRISFAAHYRERGIHYVALVGIVADSEGSLTFSMRGEARSTFRCNRLGFVVLHSMAVAGATVAVEHADGSTAHGLFPVEIDPWIPFTDVTAMQWSPGPGMRASLLFTGDVFEVEDQRNWSDASFKTYCTPLRLPFPVTVVNGEHMERIVRLEVQADDASSVVESAPSGIDEVVVSHHAVGPLPAIGLAVRNDAPMPSEEAIERLRLVHPSHLRTMLELDVDTWPRGLARVSEFAGRIDAQVELEVIAPEPPALDRLAREIARVSAPVRAVAMFARAGSRSGFDSTADLLKRAAAVLAPLGIVVGGGTRANFTELNRLAAIGDLPLTLLERVCYSVNPQVHAFDEDSIIETLAAQRVQCENAVRCSDGRPLDVVVTLKPRFNAASGVVAAERDPTALPDDVDQRQVTLFAAAWTVGSLAAMSAGGVASLTMHEAVGMRGIMADDEPVVLHPEFPSEPGTVFPVYHVLHGASSIRGARLLRTEVGTDLQALAVRSGRMLRVVVANSRRKERAVRLRLPPLRPGRVRLLDEETVAAACAAPEGFIAGGAPAAFEGGHVTIRLRPWAVAFVDAECDDPEER